MSQIYLLIGGNLKEKYKYIIVMVEVVDMFILNV